VADAAIESSLDPTAPPAPVSAAGSSSAAIPDPTQEPTRLNAAAPPPEPAKETQILQEVNSTSPLAPVPPVKTPVAEPPPLVKNPAPKPPAPKTPAPTPKTAAVNEPTGDGFVVQVAAVKERSEADTIAKRLSSKGFKSFVSSPSAGAARVYRVRVGKFNDRREAENVARRLEKEEQFKPWITR
jgi:cell division septation protein DedD